MAKDKKILKIGDKVIWRGNWGKDNPAEAVVTNIEKTSTPNSKYGECVESVLWTDNFIVDLDNGHFAYSCQLKPIN